MFLDDIQPVRARKMDPVTSHAAARNAYRFANGHKARIMEALQQGPRTADALAAMTGLSIVQVDRRLPELRTAGLAEVMTADGADVVVNGYRVWKATTQKTKPAVGTAGL